jgi:uncharacterized caspase-like protein
MKKYLLIGLVCCTSCGSEPKPKFTPNGEAPKPEFTPNGNISSLENVSQQPRYALVIGNGNYNGQDVSILKNPANDVALVSQSLKAVGFNVTTQINVDRNGLFQAVEQLSRQLRSDTTSVGLFYYAGHGMEVGEINYLLPVDLSVTAKTLIELETNLQKGGYPLPNLISSLAGAHNSLNLVYLDACRNNPFRGRSIGGRSGGSKQGFRNLDVQPSDIYIGYSTALGNLALDGDEKPNSPFAAAFATAVQQPNQSFEDTYKSVTASVLQETSNTQQPWSSGTTRKKFVFFPNQPKTDAPPVPAKVDNAPIAVTPIVDPAEMAFNNLQKSQKLADWKNFVATYPKSTYLNTANIKIAALEQELKRALNDANLMKQDLPEAAKTELLKAKNIAPEHTEVIALDQFLNKK